uniref:Uncharacterized protein n=1 Tax=Lactuca sativa TaxID=4236 RepID=A0A9R1UFT9_LACSA|nr:hypothetical protein LSAT_V11C900500040 [Lactuca sativa]
MYVTLVLPFTALFFMSKVLFLLYDFIRGQSPIRVIVSDDFDEEPIDNSFEFHPRDEEGDEYDEGEVVVVLLDNQAPHTKYVQGSKVCHIIVFPDRIPGREIIKFVGKKIVSVKTKSRKP